MDSCANYLLNLLKVNKNTIYNSEKNCHLEKYFGLSVETHTDGKSLIVTKFLPEAKLTYESKIKKGFTLSKINGIEVNSYNINNILHRVLENPDNPKLTFQTNTEDDLSIDIKQLLTLRTATENIYTNLIKDSMCSMIYICASDVEYDTNDDKSVLYCFPRPYNKNFLYNTRGAYVTLNHLAPKCLGTSEPHSTAVLHNGSLLNVTYISQNQDLFLVAFPNKVVDIFASTKIVQDVVKLIELLYGSLRACFTRLNSIDKLDIMFTRMFIVILGEINKKSTVGDVGIKSSDWYFENILPAAQSVMLPLEAKIQVDDALTELEAADYREWVRF